MYRSHTITLIYTLKICIFSKRNDLSFKDFDLLYLFPGKLYNDLFDWSLKVKMYLQQSNNNDLNLIYFIFIFVLFELEYFVPIKYNFLIYIFLDDSLVRLDQV